MIRDPYIPEQVVDPEDFVGRYEEIEKCKTFLEFRIDSKPRNIAIIGDWGIGKTALLRKFEDIAIQNESPSARFDVRKDMSLLKFQQRLLLELKTALSLHEKLSVKAKEFLSGFDVSMGYAGVSVKKMKTQTIDFRQKLLEMWNGLKDSVPAVLVMLDNAEGLKQIPGANEELRNTFQRLSEYDCKYVLVIAGKPDLFAGITSIYEPFARFFNFIELKPFTYEEVKDAIEKPSEYIPHLKFEPETIAEIYRKSEGHPFIVKSMCSTTYIMMKGEGVITKNIVERFMPRILYDLGKKVFSDRFASASPIEQRILIAMASFDGNSLNYSEIAKMSDASKKKVGTFLSRLTEKDLVRKVERGQYELFHPLFKEYLKNFVIGGGDL
jgi:hypothetical protein